MRRLARLWQHATTGLAHVRRAFPEDALRAIEQAVAESERQHAGQLRFVVEAALEPGEVWEGVTPREQALEVFGRLRVWDTLHNDGVLIYVLLADRDVEIVADRGLAAIAAAEWENVCRTMEAEFRAGRYREGALAGIAGAGTLLRRAAPPRPGGANEQPDAPTTLR